MLYKGKRMRIRNFRLRKSPNAKFKLRPVLDITKIINFIDYNFYLFNNQVLQYRKYKTHILQHVVLLR